jgi:glycosyltransferase involved in cell wall biosynthesis
MRGAIEGIGPDDKVVLWGGGVYNWFDPLTLIRAIDRLKEQVPEVRLVFMGMTHPNPGIPKMRMAVETVQLSDELGLTGKHVFFNDTWVALDERHNFLLESDVAVATHFDGLETDFAFRTRILDCMWSSLPVVATEGDHHRLGTMAHQFGIDAVASPQGGFAADAGIDDLPAEILRLQPAFQQCDPARSLRQAILGGQAVAEDHQHRRGRRLRRKDGRRGGQQQAQQRSRTAARETDRGQDGPRHGGRRDG